jgi:predicted acyltransferase
MATSLELLGLLLILLVNTAATALSTRFFRVRLHTRWGSAIYTALLVPVLLFVITLVLAGGLRIGPDLGSAGAVVGLTVLLPMALGIAFDYFWMPAPDEVDLPEPDRERDREPRRSRR